MECELSSENQKGIGEVQECLITILPADKGGDALHSDTTTFRKLRENPTTRVDKCITDSLKELSRITTIFLSTTALRPTKDL